MLNSIKNFDAEKFEADELVELSAHARKVAEEYEKLNLEQPTWLEDKTREIRRELEARTADMKAKRVKEIKAQLSSLRTAAEKREDLEKELARLVS